MCILCVIKNVKLYSIVYTLMIKKMFLFQILNDFSKVFWNARENALKYLISFILRWVILNDFPSDGSNPQSVTSTIKTNNLLCSEGFEQNLGDQAYLQAGPVPVINQSTPDAWQMIWGNIFCPGCHSWGNIYQPLVVMHQIKQ